MNAFTRTANLVIRAFQHRDLDAIEQLCLNDTEQAANHRFQGIYHQLAQVRQWYGLLKFLSLFPNPLRYYFCTYVAEQAGKVLGMIQISPFNRTHSTWRVDRVATETGELTQGVGSQLLRFCLESVWEARTWLLEVDVNDKGALALYRQNGFQPLAQLTYWAIAPELLRDLAVREPDLPNLLPVSNADAQLLYQLDTVAMPPLVRQVFDRHITDFKTSLFGAVVEGLRQWFNRVEVVSGYVFEPQRKAAIGYFQVQLCRDGSRPHSAQLTVHPAYTWLYPEMLAQMARIAQELPPQTLRLASADYQPEREEYLEQIGATRQEHTLMMSRSVWHKLRELKPSALEGLQLSEVLQGFQPARKPVPGRISMIPPLSPNYLESNGQNGKGTPKANGTGAPENNNRSDDSATEA